MDIRKLQDKAKTSYTVFANRKAWWKCKDCGREWNTLISTRSGGSKCPYCSGYIFLKGFNDLQTTHPEIASEWSEKNLSLKPDEVNAKSRKNVWWKCRKCGNEWKSVINARVKGTVLLGVPLETYIPSEKLAIESGSADENIEIMKAYMCKQRGIRMIKLPMKGTELDYANSLKKAFQSVHIFISSDTEEDVEIIKNTFERWRDSQ